MILVKYWKLLVAVAIAFLLSVYLGRQVELAKSVIELENKVEQQESYIDGRKGVDNATKNVRGIGSDAALEWLLNRKQNSKE